MLSSQRTFFLLPVVAEEDNVECRRGVVVVEGRRKEMEVEVEVRVSMGMSWQTLLRVIIQPRETYVSSG